MGKLILLLLCATVLIGDLVASTSYDYSASVECLAEPQGPQYAGGIIRNPEFNDALRGWSGFGNSTIEQRTSQTGNWFSVAHSRSSPHQSMSQEVYLQKGMMYTFSAWVQVNKGNASVTVVFKTSDDLVHAGAVEAQSGCWSMVKGGLTAKSSGPVEFYFESKNTAVEIWVDNVSLQPFTEDQWRAQQEESINKIRKKTFTLQAVDANGNALPGASISIQHQRPGFPFGCAIASTILNNAAYQNWFTSRFTVTTFENEMKWYATEPVQGEENYSTADAMLAFVKQHNISVRGHNVLWDDPRYQPSWVKSLSAQQLHDATNRRVNSIISKYRGQLIAWDVVNENLHFSFFESRLGGNESSIIYHKVQQLDPNTLLFMNEFNTLEQPIDETATPAKYLQKFTQIKSLANSAQMAIGLEGHFDAPDLSYMRSALDTLAAATQSIWLTEVDVSDSNKAKDLENILREAYSHPAVRGIVIWGAWHPKGCYRMCLTDDNFKNLPTGDVVDKLIAEWKTNHVVGKTDADGLFKTQLFHGDYKISINHPSGKSPSMQSLKVNPDSQDGTILSIQVQVI